MINSRISSNRRPRGAFAVEALISVALLSLVAVAVSRFAGTVSRMRRLQADRTEAVELAANCMEELFAAVPEELASISQEISSDQSRPSANKFDIQINISPRAIKGQAGRSISIDVTNKNHTSHSLAHLEGWTTGELEPAKEEGDDD